MGFREIIVTEIQRAWLHIEKEKEGERGREN